MKIASLSNSVLACLCGILLAETVSAQKRDVYEVLREQMVEKFIAAEGITNPRVLAAMHKVPRHEFVSLTYRRQAYFDAALPIGYRQTISPPFIVAYMTETIAPEPTDKVLEIGTGSGHQAAVLAELAAEVYTIEIVEGLGRAATARLKRLGYDNVHTKIGDGYQGWPEHAPFDKIIVTCSPEKVPRPLIEQLKDGGRMIIPLGERYQQVFHLLEKKDGKLVQKKLIPTLFVPMTGISERQRQVKPDPQNPRIVNGGFEDDENEDGKPDHWHYQRQAALFETAKEGRRALKLQNSTPERTAQVLQGFAVDGQSIGTLKFSFWYRSAGVKPGVQQWQQPVLHVSFYNTQRRVVANAVIGGMIDDADWRQISRTVRVPPDAREMIIRLSLNGSVGTVIFDDVRMEVIKR